MEEAGRSLEVFKAEAKNLSIALSLFFATVTFPPRRIVYRRLIELLKAVVYAWS
ncbi:MAG: hypothetical protein QW114_07980 [Candidatus Nezhaarchaeales archaeon]